MMCTQKLLIVIITVTLTMLGAVIPIKEEQCVNTISTIVPIVENEEPVTEVVSDVPTVEEVEEVVELNEVEEVELVEEVEEVEEVESTIFKVTAYCPCVKCCGKSDGITATGVKAIQGRTIAVDPRYIPYGTEVTINGNTYVAEDCGGNIKGNRIDIYFDNHNEALQFGVQHLEGVVDW